MIAEVFEVRRPSPLWRTGEIAVSALALVVLSPLLFVLSILIVLADGLPVLYRQHRVGRHGTMFELLKFRSMRKSNGGPQITSAGDPRVTGIGKILRKYKLDEIPQLWNVIRGDMAIVGPRPEVPKYVDNQDPRWKAILMQRPGITDAPTLVYRNEEEILAKATHPEQFYRDVILPDKLALNLAYGRRSSPLRDLQLLFLSVRYSFWPAGFDSALVRARLVKD